MALQQFQEQASLEKGDSPRGGEMPAGQRGPLSTRGTSEAGGGVLLWNLLLGVKELREPPQSPVVTAPFSRKPECKKPPLKREGNRR